MEIQDVNEQERMQFFYEMFHSSLDRLGPGNEACTLRAIDAVRSASRGPLEAAGDDRPRILDLGCGTGPQTLVLAKHLGGSILAVDHHEPNLDALRRRAEQAGVSDRIRTCCEDMRKLVFDDGSFDVIWSEGALFCMDFREGLTRCRGWLRDGGCLAVSELCWLQAGAPEECRSFIEGAYPVMTDVEGNLRMMRSSGYSVLDHFIVPVAAWTDAFYTPLEKRIGMLRERHAGNPELLDMIASVQLEIDQYRKFSAYYGYVFCVLQR